MRTRRSSALGTPEESITAAKKAKLIDLAHVYIQTHDDPHRPWRIDVVAVELKPDGRVTRMELIENAVN